MSSVYFRFQAHSVYDLLLLFSAISFFSVLFSFYTQRNYPEWVHCVFFQFWLHFCSK